jgi:large subunit ribosomal protein L2
MSSTINNINRNKTEQINLFTSPGVLITGWKNKAGRNYTGRKTFFHKGGGRKLRYRYVDFFRSLQNIAGIVRTIEKDPIRTAAIALVCYANETLGYIIAPTGLRVNQIVYSGDLTNVNGLYYYNVGYSFPLNLIPVGAMVHNIEAETGKGAQYMRAAGSAAQVLRTYADSAIVRFKSGEYRKLPGAATASIGIPDAFSFLDNQRVIRKAGLNRYLNRRPIVRGCAMNPVDHPHGGNTSSKFGSFTPWGKVSKGRRTSKYKRMNPNVLRVRDRLFSKK